MVDEFRTSKKCYYCGGDMASVMSMTGGASHKPRRHQRVRLNRPEEVYSVKYVGIVALHNTCCPGLSYNIYVIYTLQALYKCSLSYWSSAHES